MTDLNRKNDRDKLMLMIEPRAPNKEDRWFSALTMQDSITESKTLNYILFMVFC